MNKKHNSDWDDEHFVDLCSSLGKLKTKDECKKFLRDLCTVAELKAMSERFRAVRLLEEGQSYRSISKETGLSTATVTRIAHWLNNGMGGYKLILNRYE